MGLTTLNQNHREELKRMDLDRLVPHFVGESAWKSRAARLRAFLLAFCTVLLSACGGGGGGESGGGLAIGNGQQPDPVVVDFAVAYVRRPLQVDQDGVLVAQSVRNPLQFRLGAQLVLRDRASPSSAERVLTDRAFATTAVPDPQYDVRGVEASYDGSQLVFSMRAPAIPNSNIQPTWDIWIYDVPTDTLRKAIDSTLVDDAGDDIDPYFLPDGRIVFSSNRQRRTQAVLLDEGKPQYAALTDNAQTRAIVLHVMKPDGTDIRQLSFNVSHDLDPTVTQDGRIMFSRWDNANGRDRISLYSVRPDGSELSRVYGFNSHDTGTANASIEFVDARPLDDDSLLVRLAPTTPQADQGTDLVVVDVRNFSEIDRPVPSAAAMPAPAQKSLFTLPIRSDAGLSAAGRYRSGFPLLDGTERVLVTWSPCRLQEGTGPTARIVPCGDDPGGRALPAAAPLYGVWVFDPRQNTQQPVVRGVEGRMIDEAVVLLPRSLPLVLLDPVPGVDVDEDLVTENAGILQIRSVYDIDGVDQARPNLATRRDPSVTPAANRPARFLRLIRPVLRPPNTVRRIRGTSFGRANSMREVIGYAPIEPDGSVMEKVPADVAFTIAIVDGEGRQTSGGHNYWLQVSPGGVLACNGCHQAGRESAHGRADAEPASINAGAPVNGPFPNANPAISADVGETMAETRARRSGLPEPSLDLLFTDVWSDPARTAPAAAFAWRFSQLATPVPTTPACMDDWSSRCRATIHYPVHIQPIFELVRQVLAVDGVTVLEDRTCTLCHSPVNAMSAAQVPAAQLDLSGSPSPDEADHTVGYRELLFGDVEQELLGAVLRDRLIPLLDGNGNIVFELDAMGMLLLDELGQPIPVLVTVPVAPTMSPGGALASAPFFAPFAADGSHVGYLSPVELKLLREWLDIGGQYYNDPFVAPPP